MAWQLLRDLRRWWSCCHGYCSCVREWCRHGGSAHGGFRREGDVASRFSQGCRRWQPQGLQVLPWSCCGERTHDVVQICVLGNDVKVMACCYGGAFSGKWWRFLAVAEQWLPALECDARVSGLWERWKMMTWQCLIGAYVFARINATWLVLIGQF